MNQTETFPTALARIEFGEQQRGNTLAERLAHRLRNPLTTIMSCSSQLLETAESQLAEADRKLLAWIAAAAENQAGSIERLLKAYGSLTVTPRRCNLGQAVLRTSQLYKPNENTSLKITLPQDDPVVVADTDLIHELLSELLNNAVEAQGGEVQVNCGIVTDEVRLQITNFLPASSDNWRQRFGEAFFTTKPGHTGLGVVIARRYAKLFGGTIKVENTLDEVSVTLSLPRYLPKDISAAKGIRYAENPDC
jgi:signal transduction histidine kinase